MQSCVDVPSPVKLNRRFRNSPDICLWYLDKWERQINRFKMLNVLSTLLSRFDTVHLGNYLVETVCVGRTNATDCTKDNFAEEGRNSLLVPAGADTNNRCTKTHCSAISCTYDKTLIMQLLTLLQTPRVKMMSELVWTHETGVRKKSFGCNWHRKTTDTLDNRAYKTLAALLLFRYELFVKNYNADNKSLERIQRGTITCSTHTLQISCDSVCSCYEFPVVLSRSNTLSLNVFISQLLDKQLRFSDRNKQSRHIVYLVEKKNNTDSDRVCSTKEMKGVCSQGGDREQHKTDSSKQLTEDEVNPAECLTICTIPTKCKRINSNHPLCSVTSESADYVHSFKYSPLKDTPNLNSNRSVERRSLVSLSNHKKAKTPHSDESADAYVHIIRDLTWLTGDQLPVPAIDITVANVLDPIFNQLAHGNELGPQTTMKYELLRLCTLRNFPKTDKPYIIRLAGAGFYYASEGDEVVCYCCGSRYRNWTAECRPMEIHRRISPNCPFLTENTEVNIPVPPASTEVMERFADLNDLIREEEDRANDSGYDTDISAGLWSRGPSRGTAGNTALNARAPQQDVCTNSNTNNLHSNGLQPPKHPHYGVLTTRFDSFLGWQTGNGQQPEVLADAGFYYVGLEDCVRCYQCGLGLRHWAPEDDPWVEHARWSINNPCPYLIKKKGEEFMEMVRLALEITQNEPAVPSTDAPEDSIEQPECRGQTAESNESNQTPESNESNSRSPASATGDNAAGNKASLRSKSADTGGNQAVGTATPVKSTHGNNTTAPKQKTSPGRRKDAPVVSEQQRTLLEENTRLRDQTMCKICFERHVCMVFLPCGHLVTCAECAPSLRVCPICRRTVKGTVKTYMS